MYISLFCIAAGVEQTPRIIYLSVNLSFSLPPPDSNSPQVVKKPPVSSSEDWNAKRPSDDTVSTISSLHSSPTVSPQGSPRKGVLQKQKTLFTLQAFKR